MEKTGTSMAAPLVTGIVATIMSRHNTNNVELIKRMLYEGDYGVNSKITGLPDKTVNRIARNPFWGSNSSVSYILFDIYVCSSENDTDEMRRK